MTQDHLKKVEIYIVIARVLRWVIERGFGFLFVNHEIMNIRLFFTIVYMRQLIFSGFCSCIYTHTYIYVYVLSLISIVLYKFILCSGVDETSRWM